MNDSKQIATTILNQLGANKFIAMTGAKEFSVIKNGIRFKLPAQLANRGINIVLIELNGKDLYNLRFYKHKGTKLDLIQSEEDVYAETLTAAFREVTGLDTDLGQ